MLVHISVNLVKGTELIMSSINRMFAGYKIIYDDMKQNAIDQGSIGGNLEENMGSRFQYISFRVHNRPCNILHCIGKCHPDF